MNYSSEYIITQIENIISLFPYIKIRYEYKALGKEHFLEVLPVTYYNENDKYIDLEIEITKNFEEKFPEETICFVSEGSLYSIKSVFYESQGFLFGVDYNPIDISDYSSFSIESIETNQNLKTLNFIEVAESSRNLIKYNISVANEIKENGATCFKNQLDNNRSFRINFKVNNNTEERSSDNKSYAMAA